MKVNDWKGNPRLEKRIKVSELLNKADESEDCSFMEKPVLIQHVERYIEMIRNREPIIFLGLFVQFIFYSLLYSIYKLIIWILKKIFTYRK